MRYERRLSEIAGDDIHTSQLLVECAELRAGLETTTIADGEPLLYEQLVELKIKAVDHIMVTQEALRGRRSPGADERPRRTSRA